MYYMPVKHRYEDMAKKRVTVPTVVRRERIFSYLESVKIAKTASEIAERLNQKNDWSYSRRTIERDLLQMSETHGIVQTHGHPAGYKISPDFNRQYQLRMGEEELQVLALALTVMEKQSPKFLKPLLKFVDVAIATSLPKPMRQELERFKDLCQVRGQPSGISLVSDPIQILLLFEALRKKRVVEGFYESPYDKKRHKQARKLGPVAIEVFGGSYYLMAEDHDIPERPLKRFLLARFKSIKLTDQSFEPKPIPKNQGWESSYSGLNTKDQINVRIDCGHVLGTYLSENEIHASQKVEKSGKDYAVTFSLPMGAPFLRFLAGFAWDIKKLEPKEVADELNVLLQQGIEALSA